MGRGFDLLIEEDITYSVDGRSVVTGKGDGWLDFLGEAEDLPITRNIISILTHLAISLGPCIQYSHGNSDLVMLVSYASSSFSLYSIYDFHPSALHRRPFF